jgi:hypothetical protein
MRHHGRPTQLVGDAKLGQETCVSVAKRHR